MTDRQRYREKIGWREKAAGEYRIVKIESCSCRERQKVREKKMEGDRQIVSFFISYVLLLFIIVKILGVSKFPSSTLFHIKKKNIK